jgi:spore coat protein U-like protein
MRALKTFAVALLLMISVPPLFAANCSWIQQPTAMAFGAYSVFPPAQVATATTFSFKCTPNQYARILLSQGSSGSFTPRSMNNTVAYNIFLDAAGTQIWGDASGGSVTYDVYNSAPQNTVFNDTMYGIAAAGGDYAAGNYTDTVYAVLGYSNNAAGPFTTLPPVAIAVSLAVPAECRVDAFNLDFGTYNPFAVAALNRGSLLKVYCTKASAPTSIVLNSGSNPLGSQRRMAGSNGGFLAYDAALASTVGSSTSSLVPINGGFVLNGSVAAQQDVPVGSYKDTLVATVNY